MIPIPSARLVRLGAATLLFALAVLAFPGAGLYLLSWTALLLFAAVVDFLISPGANSLDVERVAPERLSVRSAHRVEILLRNRSKAAVQVRVRDTIPNVFQTDTEELTATIAPQAQERWAYQVTPAARGRFEWGPIHLRSRSLLGLWEWQKRFDAPGQARVYPNLAALHRFHLLARTNPLEVLGTRKVRRRGGAWEFESLRDYSHGDDIRLIDWKATAKRSKLIVRNQQAERNQTIILLVDSGRLMNAEVDGVAKLDQAVDTALMLAYIALSRGDQVGLCTFSHKVHAWVVPRAHLSQIRAVTETLYDLRGDFTETDHGRCLRLLAARHPKRALLVVLTDFVDAQTASEMIDNMQRAARRHVVLFAAFRDRFLDEAARCHPRAPFEGFRKAAAVDLLRERREVLERLRKMGAHVLDAVPAAITLPLINRYLEIRFRGLL